MSKLREVIGRTKKKIYCQGTLCWRCILVALWIIVLDLTKAGNQAVLLKYSTKKVVFYTSLQQLFKCMATNLYT
jgi:hypothetical protein